MNNHEQERQLIEQYRKRAKLALPEINILISKQTYNEFFPSNYGSVQIGEDGAFVECMIWIRKEDLV